MHIELLIVEDCPHAHTALALLRQALDDVGLDGLPIETAVVASEFDAQRRGFVGSPSFFADGRDLLADATASPAHACRLYRTAASLSPLPDLTQLRQALRLAADSTA